MSIGFPHIVSYRIVSWHFPREKKESLFQRVDSRVFVFLILKIYLSKMMMKCTIQLLLDYLDGVCLDSPNFG